MNAIEVLKTRRSCRHYTEEQIRREDLQVILDCALNAPSAMNKQDTKIIVIQDPITIKALSKLNAAVMNGKSDPFYGAPTLCLILAPKGNKNGVKDGSLVIGAMQSAAYAINVGSCWINRCKEMLELPEGQVYLKKWNLEEYEGVGCCILGYPAKEYDEKKILDGRVIFD